MSQALYRKWRPGTWDEVIGQEHIIQTLKNAIRSEKVGHAYLFAGPRGTGKTTTARLLAKAVNCLDESPNNHPCAQCANCQSIQDGRFLDLIEIDAASNTSVDDIRDLRDKINFSPGQGKYKVYIIDEVHMLSTAAFNALLKTLEEPPAHAIFILATTEIHKIPATVLSRCQRHEFRRIPVKEIATYLKEMCDVEKFTITDDALLSIARHSTGCMRDAISLLDQLTSSGLEIDLANVHAVLGTATNQMVIDLMSAIRMKAMGSGLTSLHQAMDAGSDPRQLSRQIVDYFRNLLLMKMGNADQIDETPEIIQQMQVDCDGFEMSQLVHCLKLFNEAANGQSTSWQPGLALELAFSQTLLTSAAAPKLTQMPARQPLTAAQTVQNTEQPQTSKKTVSVPPAKQTIEESTPVPLDQSQKMLETPQPMDESHLTLSMVLEQWRQVRATVKKVRPATEALLNSCKPMSLKKGVLTLGFASEVVRSKMDLSENLDLARQAIAHLFNQEVQIRCVVIKEMQNIENSQQTNEESMLNTVLNLGGKLVNSDTVSDKTD